MPQYAISLKPIIGISCRGFPASLRDSASSVPFSLLLELKTHNSGRAAFRGAPKLVGNIYLTLRQPSEIFLNIALDKRMSVAEAKLISPIQRNVDNQRKARIGPLDLINFLALKSIASGKESINFPYW